MDSLNSNDKKVNEQSTVKSLIENNPSTFNGLAEAVDGLADITDKGIDRIITAVNGLNKAISTSNSDTVKEAVSKVIAREMQASEQIIEIEINDDKDDKNPVVNRAEKSIDIEKALSAFKPEKPKSINIDKALASFKNDKPNFYQHASTSTSATETTNNTHNSTVNSPASEQSQQVNNTVNAAAGGRETVFNQLESLQTKQLDTFEKVSEIDTKVSAGNYGLTTDQNKATSHTSNQSTLNGDRVVDVNVVSDTTKQSVSRVSASNNSTVTNNAKAGNTTNNTTNNKAPSRPIKNMTVGRPVFDRSTSHSDTRELNNTSDKITLATKELFNVNESVSDLSDLSKEVSKKSTKAITKVITKESAKLASKESGNTTNNATNHYGSDNVKTTKATSQQITNNASNSHQASVTANKSGAVNSTAIANANTDNSISAIDARSNAPVSKSKADKQPSQGKSTKGFYKDAGGRLRTRSGKYASKEQIKKYNKQNKNGSIKSAIAKHLTGRGSRTILGTAFLGSAYPALEEAYHISQTVKGAAQARGLNSVDGVKKYAAKKRDKLSSAASNTIDSTKSSSKNVLAKVRNLFARGNNKSSVNVGGVSSSNTSTSSVVKSTNNATNTSNDNATSSAVEQALNVTDKATIKNSTKASNATNTANAGDTKTQVSNAINNTQNSRIDAINTQNSQKNKSATGSVNTTNNYDSATNNVKPSTVGGSPKKRSVTSKSAPANNIQSIEKYLVKNSAKSSSASSQLSNKTTMKKQLPLTNSVFIGAQKASDGMTKKLSKEYHDAHMLKLDKLIKAMGEIELGSGGGGRSLIDDALDLNRTRKKRKRRKARKGADLGSKPRGRFGRAKDSLKAGRFFGGGAKAAGAIGAGGAATATGAAGAAGKLGMGALGGAGRMASKAIPLLALATTAMDAYSGFTDTDKQKEVFNLKSTEEPSLGHKSSMALGSVLDLGGLTSGISGLIGDGLGALGFDGAKEAMNFDSGDIAKAIYDKGDAIATSGSGIFSSLGEGNFSGAGGHAMNLLKEVLPTFGIASGITSLFSNDEKKEENKNTTETNTKSTEINDKATSEQSESRETRSERNREKIDAARKRADEMRARNNLAGGEIDSGEDEPRKPRRFSKRVQAKIDAARKRKEEMKAKYGSGTTSSTSNVTINGISTATQSSTIENNAPVTEALTMSSNKESVTDVSTLNKNTQSNNVNQANQERGQSNEPIVITDSAKTHSLLKEISNKLELNRKTEKPNNNQPRGGVNSMPTNIPAQFSDSLMERLANE